MRAGTRGSLFGVGLIALALSLGACSSGGDDGPVLETVARPVFDPSGGSATGSVTVSLATATPGASIRYTIDGSNPSASAGTPYTAPFTLDTVGAIAVKAIAYADLMNSSAVVTRTFTISAVGQAAAPEFGPEPGAFDSAQTVALTSDTAGADIYFELTSNGAEPPDPTTASRQYIGPVRLAQTAPPGASTQYKIKAIAVMSGMSVSPAAAATYAISTPGTAVYALKVTGKTEKMSWGESMLNVQFDLTGVTDFTTGNYVATFDVYVPGSSSTPSKIQTQYPNSDWKPMFFDAYAVERDVWQTLTYTLTKANRAYPASDDAAPLISDAEKFRIVYHTVSEGESVEFYVRNIRITNGSKTPLDIAIGAATTVGSLGLYTDAGDGVGFDIVQR